jgi:hypothetical protein
LAGFFAGFFAAFFFVAMAGSFRQLMTLRNINVTQLAVYRG